MATTINTVTLTHEQRDAFCSFAWGVAHDSTLCNADPDDEFRFYMAIYRLVDRLQWRSNEPERDTYELPVDAGLQWAMAYRLAEDVEDDIKPCVAEEAERSGVPSWVTDDEGLRGLWVEERAKEYARYRNVIAVNDAILEVAGDDDTPAADTAGLAGERHRHLVGFFTELLPLLRALPGPLPEGHADLPDRIEAALSHC